MRRFVRTSLLILILVLSVHAMAATEVDPRLRSAYQYVTAAVVIHPSYTDGAITLFTQVAGVEKGNVEAQVMAAIALDVVRGDPLAASFYRTAAEQSSDPAFTVLWADHLLRSDKLDEAEALYRDVLADDETFTAAWIGLGRIALLRESPEAAVEPLEKALTLDARRIDTRIYLARAYLGVGQPRQALTLLEEREEGVGRPVAYYTTLAQVQATLGDAAAACLSIERIRDAWSGADIRPLLSRFDCRQP